MIDVIFFDFAEVQTHFTWKNASLLTNLLTNDLCKKCSFKKSNI